MGPFTSKDIDFFGNRRVVEACAASLQGRYSLPSREDHTPNAGLVVFHDHAGNKVEIDILHSVYGVDEHDIERTKIPIDVPPTQEGAVSARFFAMHPVLCMESRACNVIGLNRNKPHELRQLKASVLCARQFLRELLALAHREDIDDADRRRLVRDVLNLNERIFQFCLENRDGRKVLLKTNVDLFDAVVCEAPLPEMFRERRYPQMVAHLKQARSRAASAAASMQKRTI